MGLQNVSKFKTFGAFLRSKCFHLQSYHVLEKNLQSPSLLSNLLKRVGENFKVFEMTVFQNPLCATCTLHLRTSLRVGAAIDFREKAGLAARRLISKTL